MRNYIRDSKDLVLLKRNSRLETGNLYLLQSESTANNVYFESKKGIAYARSVFKKHFEGIVDIVFELFTTRGFVLMIKVKEANEIKNCWKKRGKEGRNVSHILSEIIRYSISAIVKFQNNLVGRKGSLVRGNFRTYILRDEQVFREVLKKLKEGTIRLYDQRPRYRGGLVKKGLRRFRVVREISIYVLRKLILTTLKTHFPHKTQNLNLISSS